jgi:hypothetical protein
MPETTQATLFLLRTHLREQLLRAAETLDDEQCADADALALVRNTAADVLATVDTVVNSPALTPAWAA